jgi:hypothetical protein
VLYEFWIGFVRFGQMSEFFVVGYCFKYIIMLKLCIKIEYIIWLDIFIDYFFVVL